MSTYTYTEYNRPSVQKNNSGYGSLAAYNSPMDSPYNYSATPLLKQGGQGVTIIPSMGGSGYLKLQHGVPRPSGTGFFRLDQAYRTGPGCSSTIYSSGGYCHY